MGEEGGGGEKGFFELKQFVLRAVSACACSGLGVWWMLRIGKGLDLAENSAEAGLGGSIARIRSGKSWSFVIELIGYVVWALLVLADYGPVLSVK